MTFQSHIEANVCRCLSINYKGWGANLEQACMYCKLGRPKINKQQRLPQTCHGTLRWYHKPRSCHTELRRTSPKTSHTTIGPHARGPNPIKEPNRRSSGPTTATSTIPQQSGTIHHERLEPATVTTLTHIRHTANCRQDEQGWTRVDDVGRG